MDEFIEVFELLSDFSEFSDLSEAGIDLAEIVEMTDLDGVDPDALQEFSELDELSFEDGMPDLTEVPELADISPSDDVAEGTSGFGDSSAGGDTEWSDLAGDQESFDYLVGQLDANGYVEEMQNLFPESMFQGLEQVEYQPEVSPEGPDHHGRHILANDGSGEARIELYDHRESLHVTVPHELGHHMMATEPQFKAELSQAVENSGFLNSLEPYLTAYSGEAKTEEACAYAFSYLQNNPTVLAEKFPEVAEVLRSRMK